MNDGAPTDSNWIFLLFLLLPGGAGALLYAFGRSCRKKKSAVGWTRLLLGNLLTLLFLLATAFTLGEAYYRFCYDTTDSLAYTKVSMRWLDRHHTLNAAGFRDDIEYTLGAMPGKRRISFLGDSFTAGHGVKDVNDRFPNLIRRDHPEWEINLLARLGADTGHEVKCIEDSVNSGYQLDEVVLVYNLNDVADLMPEWKASLTRIFSDEGKGGWLRHNSYLVDTLYHRWKLSRDPEMQQYFDFVRKGYEGSLWDQQQQRLTALRDLVQAHGGRLVVVTFPFLHDLGPKYAFRSVHDRLDRFWTGAGVPHIDLLPVYQDLPPSKLVVNRYDAHPNEFAHALAARTIEPFLVEQMKANEPAK